MRLSEFIRGAADTIVSVSADFAKTLPSMSGTEIDVEVLRDHLPLVLDAIALDLEQPQSRFESIRKSEGGGPVAQFETAAQVHGRLRADNGLTVAHLVAEYRVLRASVLRLWLDAGGGLGPEAAADIARFNEAIDQAIAESVAYHSAAVEKWRQTLLAVIGHDLRGPLNAIVLTTEVLSGEARDEPVIGYAASLKRSAHRMAELLDSLLEYNRTLLGAPMKLECKATDLAAVAGDEIEQLRAALPGVQIVVESEGPLDGDFDANRVREALANLVFNAAQYRRADSAVRVKLRGTPDAVHVSVLNEGDPIDSQTLASFFEPLRRRENQATSDRRNLGLGLFIVREVARAHGGNVGARAEGGVVEFTMVLPRRRAQGS